jgi:hypothetical protein
MYASHRDACILSYYSFLLTRILDERYKSHGIDGAVIAYRSLGKSNYDFTADALKFAQQNAPCVVKCFDVTGFFDNLNHSLLKKALIGALGGIGLTDDWYAVFKSIARFRHISRDDLNGHPIFSERMKDRSREPIATIQEVKKAGIGVVENPNSHGIPQGTPISAVFSNLYMWDLDVVMTAACSKHGALYQRYSDDILLICSLGSEKLLTDLLETTLAGLRLKLNTTKTERAVFDPVTPETFQYLGFNNSPDGSAIRPGSLARQWRKARRSIKKTIEIGQAAIADGRATKVYTKKLRRRFSPVGIRNFSSYARRSASALGSKRILNQVRRLERMVDRTLSEI